MKNLDLTQDRGSKMKNGMKRNKGPTTKEIIQTLKVEVENLNKAFQISQMMVKHLSNKVQGLETDMNNSMGMLNDFQYRTLAMLELGDFSNDDIEKKAEELKLVDFEAASNKEDEQKGYELDLDGTINEDSVVTITSKVEGKDEGGIFRSKFHMSECVTPNIREALLEKKVGDTVEVDIYGENHKIEILQLRKVNKEEKAEQE